MTPEERKLMMKMAEQLDDLKKRVFLLEKPGVPIGQTVPTPTQPVINHLKENVGPEPLCVVTMSRDAALADHNAVHDTLRDLLIHFCKNNQIMDLQVTYKKR